MSRIIKWVIFVFVVLAGLAFHVKNHHDVELFYYAGIASMPLSWLVVLVLFIGAILGILASLPMIIKLKQQKIKLEKQIKNSEKEITNLRVMPVKD